MTCYEGINLGDYPFGADLFLVGRFQRVQQCPLSVAKVAVGWIVSDGLEFRAEGAGIGRSPQRGQELGRFLKIDGLSVVADHQLAVGPFQDLHLEAGIARPVHPGKQLQDPPVVFDRVVSSHLARVFEADGLGERQFGGYRAVSFLGLLRGHGELGVEPGQELLEDIVGLLDGGSTCQAQFGDQPVLEG